MPSPYVLFFSALTLCVSCDASKKTAAVSDTRMIVFGDGGGFAGKENAYTLTPNGNLSAKDIRSGKTSPMGNISKDQVNQIFENAVKLDLPGYNYMVPGNLYEFIEWHQDGQVNRIAWDSGKSGRPIKKEISIFYNILKNHLRNAN